MTPQQTCDELRAQLLQIEQTLENLAVLIATDSHFDGSTSKLRNEAIANATLARRHVEDARMRLGKTLQAYQGGVSALDRPDVRALISPIAGDPAPSVSASHPSGESARHTGGFLPESEALPEVEQPSG